MNIKDNKTIPTLDIFLPEMFKEGDRYLSAGYAFYEGKRQGIFELNLDFDIFKKERKPKGRERMIAYVLAYHLALLKNDGKSNQATLDVADWLGIKDEKSVLKVVKQYSIPKEAQLIVIENHLGIVAMLEPDKIIRKLDKLFYKGVMWTWKLGDEKASIGTGVLKDIDCSVIASPLLKLKNKKLIKTKT